MTLAEMEVQRYPEPIQPLQGMTLWLPGTIPGQSVSLCMITSPLGSLPSQCLIPQELETLQGLLTLVPLKLIPHE